MSAIPVSEIVDGYNRSDDDDDRTRHLDDVGVHARNVTETREAVLEAARELATGDGDTLSRESTERFETYEQLVGDLAKLERLYARIREAAKNPKARESGDGGVSPTHLQRVDPWKETMPSQGEPAMQLRSRALSAVEQAVGGVPDKASEKITRSLETDPDPEGGMARYVIETSRPEYLRAFSKWMSDPVSGGHSWTPDERQAVQRAQQLQPSL